MNNLRYIYIVRHEKKLCSTITVYMILQTSCQVKEASHKDHIVFDSICMKPSKQIQSRSDVLGTEGVRAMKSGVGGG